jgi:hypothetical protein
VWSEAHDPETAAALRRDETIQRGCEGVGVKGKARGVVWAETSEGEEMTG